jgi:hypothetical protein
MRFVVLVCRRPSLCFVFTMVHAVLREMPSTLACASSEVICRALSASPISSILRDFRALASWADRSFCRRTNFVVPLEDLMECSQKQRWRHIAFVKCYYDRVVTVSGTAHEAWVVQKSSRQAAAAVVASAWPGPLKREGDPQPRSFPNIRPCDHRPYHRTATVDKNCVANPWPPHP